MLPIGPRLYVMQDNKEWKEICTVEDWRMTHLEGQAPRVYLRLPELVSLHSHDDSRPHIGYELYQLRLLNWHPNLNFSGIVKRICWHWNTPETRRTEAEISVHYLGTEGGVMREKHT